MANRQTRPGKRLPWPISLVCLLAWLPAALLAAAAPPEVNLLLFGDWGENTPGQKKVAEAMARYVTESRLPFQAVLSVGDNFYMKLTGVKDPIWQTVFEKMYDPLRLPMPFYMAMGNHDYDGDNAAIEAAYAKAHPGTRWRLPARWYRLDFPADRPLATFLILDSNKPSMSRENWKSQIDWMEQQLSAPRQAPWMIVIGHHPLFSNGLHTDMDILQEDWGGILKKHNVDFYICGHDHSLQHLQIDGWTTTFLVTGGGGAGLSRMIRDDRGPFSWAVFGFTHLKLAEEKATVRFLGETGQTLHDFTRTRSGEIQVTKTTGHERPINAVWRTAAEVREKAASIKWLIPTTQGSNPWNDD